MGNRSSKTDRFLAFLEKYPTRQMITTMFAKENGLLVEEKFFGTR